ncbi:MAG: exonuclease SbcCD subunit D [Lachnospiraceae bacterium]|nr:exonuclease SbcCD subunit D [Lachnospiraceae bacterium]MBQ6259318.1 exonuclease SbcCD subunit D [Lachnospiraceae bacterium]
MKLLHIGDLHIGRSLFDFSLIDDQRFILDQIISVADQREVEAVIIAGDVYDRAVPSEEAVGLFDHFLRELASRHIKTFVISGNHDSDERLNFGSSLFETNEIYISSKFDGKLFKKELKDKDKTINIYLLPFVKASQVRHFYPDAEIETYEDAVRTIIDNADINEAETNILAAHQFVAGKGKETIFSGSESAGVLNVGLVEQIGASCFERFDYVALGHIHAPQQLGRETLRYCGSPLKYSLSEINNDKSMPLISIEDGNVSVELIPLEPKRDMRHIKGRMEQLLDKENIRSPEDFVYVTLTDEDVISDAMGIFQQVYPNTVRIDYDNDHTRELERVDITRIGENKSFDELISEFYQMVYKCDISDEELSIMMDAAREAGVLDEA